MVTIELVGGEGDGLVIELPSLPGTWQHIPIAPGLVDEGPARHIEYRWDGDDSRSPRRFVVSHEQRA